MHPVLGTMMPEICEAPHLPVFSRHLPLCSGFYGGRRSSHSSLHEQLVLCSSFREDNHIILFDIGLIFTGN